MSQTCVVCKFKNETCAVCGKPRPCPIHRFEDGPDDKYASDGESDEENEEAEMEAGEEEFGGGRMWEEEESAAAKSRSAKQREKARERSLRENGPLEVLPDNIPGVCAARSQSVEGRKGGGIKLLAPTNPPPPRKYQGIRAARLTTLTETAQSS